MLLPTEHFELSVKLQPIKENKISRIKTPNLATSSAVGQSEPHKLKKLTLPKTVIQTNQKNSYTSIYTYLKNFDKHAKPKNLKLKDYKVNKGLLR